MINATSKIEQVRMLRREASNLRGATQRWAEAYADHAHYDKQSFGFAGARDTSAAFRVPALAFEAYVGTYGSSSVGTAWKVDQALITRLLPKALNIHKQAIFDTIADLAEAEAVELLDGARAELASIQNLLAEISAPSSGEEA